LPGGDRSSSAPQLIAGDPVLTGDSGIATSPVRTRGDLPLPAYDETAADVHRTRSVTLDRVGAAVPYIVKRPAAADGGTSAATHGHQRNM